MQALSKFSQHDHQFAPNGLPLSFRSTRCRQPTVVDRPHSVFVQEGSGAWDLTSDARSAFYLLPLAPDQFPNQAGTHNDAPILERSNEPFGCRNPCAVLRPLASRCLSGLRHRSTLTSDLTPNVYSQPSTEYHQTGGCSWLLTSNLYHLPIAPPADRRHSKA